jgi:hypothetical protein
MRRIIFVICNLLVLAASIVFIFYAYAAAGRYFARGVIYVAPLSNAQFFSPANVELLQISFPNYTISAASHTTGHIASSSQEVSATVFYVNASYFQKHSMDFAEGNHTGIILNEALAWRLFGATENIPGLAVRLGENEYIVSGVVRQNAGGYTAWVSHNPTASNMPVSSLYIHTPNHPLAKYSARHMLLYYLHRNPAEYVIIEINRFVGRIWLPSANVFPPSVYLSSGILRLAELNRLANFAFFAAIVAVANLLFSLRFKKKEGLS